MVKNSINKYFWYPLTILSSATILFFGGDILRIKWQKEQAENFKSLKERIAQEQGGIPSLEGRMFYSFPASPSQKDVEPEYWNALQENATNPNSPIADNFDYLPEMNSPTNKAPRAPKTLEQKIPEFPEAPKVPEILKEPLQPKTPAKPQYKAPKEPVITNSIESYTKIPHIRNNNPGNLRQVIGKNNEIIKWRGQTGVDSRGFCIFDNLENGFRAAGRNLQDYSRLYGINTIKEIVERWAPRSENDTENYIARVSAQTGYHPNRPLNMRDRNVLTNLIVSISKNEHSQYVPKSLVEKSIRNL